jgi:RNA polymerase sigma-70 factor (ECF subfamily)
VPEPIGRVPGPELARSGTSEAIGELYARHADDVYRVAYRLTDSSADAMDVVQEFFLALPQAARTFDGRGSFERWITRVTVRMALMKLRERRRRREVSLGAVRFALPGRPPARSVDAIDLQRALESLSDDLRVVFVLKEIEGYSHVEIADLLGIRRNTSEVRLHRARKRLRAILGD